MSKISFFNIATSFHHIQHPISIQKNRYKQCDAKGILTFALLTICSLGIAGIVIVSTAIVKYKKLQNTPLTSKIQSATSNSLGSISSKNPSWEDLSAAILNEMLLFPDVEKVLLLVEFTKNNLSVRKEYFFLDFADQNFKEQLKGFLKDLKKEKIQRQSDCSINILIKGKSGFSHIGRSGRDSSTYNSHETFHEKYAREGFEEILKQQGRDLDQEIEDYFQFP